MSEIATQSPHERVHAAYQHIDAVTKAWQAYRAARTAAEPRDEQAIERLRKTLNDCIDQTLPLVNDDLDALAVEYLRAVGVRPGEYGAQLKDDLDKLPRNGGDDERWRRIQERHSGLSIMRHLVDMPPCYGCNAAPPRQSLTLPKLVCPACGQWELHTGISVMPVAGPARPHIAVLTGPCWQPTPPATKQAGDPSGVEPMAQGAPSMDLQAVIAALGGETAAAIFCIMQDASKTVDQKMREIYTLDNRFLGWDSPMWANLLGVSDAAVRKTDWWKNERPGLRG